MAGWSPGILRAIVAALVGSAAVLAWLTLTPAAPSAAAGECRVQGSVLTAEGAPVPGIHLQLALDRKLLNVATDAQGRYDFGPRATLGASRLSVELITEDDRPLSALTARLSTGPQASP